jgi:hypothetical protein
MTTNEELELAKTGIEQLGESGREIIRLVADSSVASETSGLLADQFRYQRFKRQLKIIQKAERLVDEAGLSPQAVPLTTLAPLIPWASLEDDEEMANRWANLLASAATSSVHVIYPELLRQLEPREARIIDVLFKLERAEHGPNQRGGSRFRQSERSFWRLKSGTWRQLEVIKQHMLPEAGWVEIDIRNLQNLDRLAICWFRKAERFMGTGSRPDSVRGHDAFRPEEGPELRLTQLGLEFALVCQPPQSDSSPI